MRYVAVRVVAALIAAVIMSAAMVVPAGAVPKITPLSVARTAYRAARASHGAMTTSQELVQAALDAEFNIEVAPNGYEHDFDKTLPNDHGVAMLVSAAQGGFGCVYISSSIATPPSTVPCPVTYLVAITSNVKVNPKYLLATQAASAIGLEAYYVASAQSGRAVSSAVPTILKSVSGVTAKRVAFRWDVTVRHVSVCLSFASNGSYRVGPGVCT
jgi:hypothetical protein